MKPRILTVDIETMANLVWTWEEYSKGGWRAIDTEERWHPISFGAKWFGEKTKYHALEDYKGYKPQLTIKGDTKIIRKPNLKPLLQEMWNYFDEADIVIGWNSTAFDVKAMRTFMIEAGMKPFSPFLEVDVMLKKRQLTRGVSNKLDSTGEQYGQGRKVSHDGWPLWYACAQGDKKAQKKMKKYCIQDVDLTELNYRFLLPWMKTHPSINVMLDERDACPKCGGKHMNKAMKYTATNSNSYQYYRCQDCGGMSKSRIPEVKVKPTYVN